MIGNTKRRYKVIYSYKKSCGRLNEVVVDSVDDPGSEVLKRWKRVYGSHKIKIVDTMEQAHV